MSASLAEIFSADGVLAREVEGYRPREAQIALSQAVANAIEENSHLLAEAGTGVGKTFAYLLPAVKSGKKVLVSTATKTLQEQIYQKDLPLVRKVMGGTVSVALLKGRRNYLCHFYYQDYLQTQVLNATEKRWRKALSTFERKTRDGDLVNLIGVPEKAPILERITSTAENCFGRDCEFFEQCFVQKARQQAKEADVVVVNHHLLLADLALKNDGFTEILPEIDAFIIDEAHHLPSTAGTFLGKRLSYRQMQHFYQSALEAQQEEAVNELDLAKAIGALPFLAQQVYQVLLSEQSVQKEGLLGTGITRIEGNALEELTDFWFALSAWFEQVVWVKSLIEKETSRDKKLSAIAKRAERLLELVCLFKLAHKEENIALDKDNAPHDNQPRVSDKSALQSDAERASFTPNAPELEKDEQDASASTTSVEKFTQMPYARWLEVVDKGFTLSYVPVNTAKYFARWLKKSEAAWCFLSATLAINESFAHFKREIGVFEAKEMILSSPFDYRKQALLYQPPNLPSPNSPDYQAQLIHAVLPILAESGGRAFLLFTSYRAMYDAEKMLKNSEYTLLVQGSAPKTDLLKQFRLLPKAVLLATASFWEGVDVRGDKLVCVIIDKLPFSAPDDPVSKARHAYLQEQGLSPFLHDTLPSAVIALKQGVGRLIRDVSDYGVLMIGDPRLREKSYGKIFLESLPRMTRTTDFTVIKRFFAHHESSQSKKTLDC